MHTKKRKTLTNSLKKIKFVSDFIKLYENARNGLVESGDIYTFFHQMDYLFMIVDVQSKSFTYIDNVGLKVYPVKRYVYAI